GEGAPPAGHGGGLLGRDAERAEGRRVELLGAERARLVGHLELLAVGALEVDRDAEAVVVGVGDADAGLLHPVAERGLCRRVGHLERQVVHGGDRRGAPGVRGMSHALALLGRRRELDERQHPPAPHVEEGMRGPRHAVHREEAEEAQPEHAGVELERPLHVRDAERDVIDALGGDHAPSCHGSAPGGKPLQGDAPVPWIGERSWAAREWLGWACSATSSARPRAIGPRPRPSATAASASPTATGTRWPTRRPRPSPRAASAAATWWRCSCRPRPSTWSPTSPPRASARSRPASTCATGGRRSGTSSAAPARPWCSPPSAGPTPPSAPRWRGCARGCPSSARWSGSRPRASSPARPGRSPTWAGAARRRPPPRSPPTIRSPSGSRAAP